MQLVRDINYASAYSFKYSPRPGTPAANMAAQLPEPVKAARLEKLQNLLNEQQMAFNKKTIGLTLPVLLDRKGNEKGQLHGRTPYNQSIHLTANERLFGQIVNVKVTNAYANSLGGEIETGESVLKSA